MLECGMGVVGQALDNLQVCTLLGCRRMQTTATNSNRQLLRTVQQMESTTFVCLSSQETSKFKLPVTFCLSVGVWQRYNILNRPWRAVQTKVVYSICWTVLNCCLFKFVAVVCVRRHPSSVHTCKLSKAWPAPISGFQHGCTFMLWGTMKHQKQGNVNFLEPVDRLDAKRTLRLMQRSVERLDC